MSKVKVIGQNVWYQQKGLATRNTYLQYESPKPFDSKLIVKIKFFSNVHVGQNSRPKSQGQNFGYERKGRASKNKYLWYESPVSFGSKL